MLFLACGHPSECHPVSRGREANSACDERLLQSILQLQEDSVGPEAFRTWQALGVEDPQGHVCRL